MKRDWKPGDVGVTAHTYAGDRSPTRFFVSARGEGLAFYYEDGDVASHGPRDDAQRLVTIALPSGALAGWPVLVDALRRAEAKTGLSMVFGGLIEQIEAQTMSKPVEPMGLGAVIEDTAGTTWVRLHPGRPEGQEWYCLRDTRSYAEISVARVLAEGWSE